MGSRRGQLYPVIGYKGEWLKAHKASWSLANGRPFPPDKMGCHHCDVTLCIQPSHIYPGTHRQNMDDMVRRDRHNKGERHGNAILTDALAYEIKMSTETAPVIGARLGINGHTIRDVRRGRSWRHIQCDQPERRGRWRAYP